MKKIILFIFFFALLCNQKLQAQCNWQQLGAAVSSTNAALTDIAIDGSGTPYIVYQDGSLGGATVMKYNGSAWVAVGSAGLGGTVYDSQIAIDGSGTPYVAFDGATVMKYNGSAWVNVGSAGFSAGYANYTSIAIDGSGTPYVVYRDYANSYKATVMKFNGSAWVTVGTAGFSASGADYTSIAIDGSGTPYVVYHDGSNSGSATVMKYNGSAWVTVGSAGFSAGSAAYTSIAIDGSGIPYVVCQDNSGVAVMKYNGSAWVSVGTPSFSPSGSYYSSIAIDGNGTPYVVYSDYNNSNKATVMKYNGSAWVNVGATGFSAGQANYTSIALDGSGKPYVVYSDVANSSKTTVMKLATPVVSVTSTSTLICSGKSATLTPSGAGAGGTYTITGGTFTVSPSVTTSYSVTGTNSAGCVATNTAVITISVNTTPTVAITGTTICSGKIATLTPSGASSYSVNNVATGTFTFNPVNTTTYAVTGASVGCVSNSVLLTVNVNTTPTVAITGTTICSGNTATLTPNGASTYSVNGAATSTFTFNPVNTTTYAVTGASVGCVSNSVLLTVNVNTTPTVAITGTTICSGKIATLTPSGASSYSVNNVATGTFTFNPVNTTTYAVTGASVGCVSNSVLLTVNVNTTPTVAITGTTICSGNTATLTPSGASTYSVNGTATSTFTFNPVNTTTYAVTGASVGCVSNSVLLTVNVNTTPTVAITGTTICSGKIATLTPSGASSYSVNNVATSNFTFSPANTTTYAVTGTSVGCVSNSVLLTVNVNTTPTVAITGTTICSSKIGTLTPSGASSYSVNNVATSNFTFSPANTTTYAVTGASLGCVSNSVLLTVNVNTTPTVAITGATICSGKIATLTPSGASSYSVNNVATSNFTFSPANTTTYAVIGASVGCVSNSVLLTLSVNTTPTVAITGTTICSGNSATLTPSGASTYTISGGTFTVSPSTTTSYSVTGTSTADCVSNNTAVIIVTVNVTSTLAVNSGSICSGDSFTIIPTGADTYSVTGNNFTVTPLAGNYSYSITGTSSVGCLSTNTAVSMLTVYETPILAVNSGSICSGDSFTIIPTGADTYSVTGNNFTVTPVAGNYSYSVTGTSSVGCAAVNTIVSTLVVNSGTICSGSSLTIVPTLYGMTPYGGSEGNGTIFSILTGSTAIGSSFSFSSSPNTNGYTPYGSLMAASNGKLYGLTSEGGANNSGVLFEYDLVTNTPVTKWDFDYYIDGEPYGYGNLLQANGKLYGMASEGGVNGYGTLFEYDINSGTLTVKQDFNYSTGVYPYGSLIQANNGKLYGMTSDGGANYNGTLFEYNILTNILSVKHHFNYGSTGSYPKGSLMQASNGLLYGMTNEGGSDGGGTLFEYNPATGTLTVNHSFNSSSDGNSPNGSLIQLNNGKLYGMTRNGAANSGGSLFEYNPVTTNLSVKFSFDQYAGGSGPFGSLLYVGGGKLYGMTNYGGSNNVGTVFEYDLTTSAFTTKLDFDGANGAYPYGDLIQVNTPTAGCNMWLSFDNTGACMGNPVGSITVTTIDGTGPYTYSWSPVAGSGSVISGLSAGIYTVMVTDVNSCSATGTVELISPAMFTVGLDGGAKGAYKQICFGNSAMLSTAYSPGDVAVSYTWIPGNITIQNAYVSPTVMTIYTVTGSDAYGCLSLNTATVQVDIDALPIVVASASSTVPLCPGTPIGLMASGANTYVWSPGNIYGDVVTVPAADVYTVIGTDWNDCSNTATIAISILPSPTLSIFGSNVMCPGATITQSVSGADTYTWSTGQTSSSIAISPSVSTIYNVVGTNTTSGCSDSTSVPVMVSSPVFSITSNPQNLCSGQNATLSINTAPAGQSLDFDGVDDYISIPYTAAINPSLFTIETWVKVNAITNDFQSIVTSRYWYPGMFKGYALYVNPLGQWDILFGNGSGGNWQGGVSGGTVQTGVWTHVAMTHDGTNMTLYVNGAVISSTAVPFAPNMTQEMRIGAGSTESYPQMFFGGQMTEFRIWNYAMNASQIQTEMNNCLSGSESGLVLYYNMTDGTGSSTLTDMTGNYNTGYLNNMDYNTVWLTNGTSCSGVINSYTWSPGGMTTSTIDVTLTTSTVYTVNALSYYGCPVNYTQNILASPVPTLSVSNGTITPGNIFTITPNGANTYSITGGNFTVSPLSTSVYTINGYAPSGCPSQPETLTVAVVTPTFAPPLSGESTYTINTVAGNGIYGNGGDGGLAVNAEVEYPVGVAVDAAGDIYIADPNTYRVRKIDVVTGTISAFAGDGNSGYYGDGGSATSAQLRNPYAVAVDAAGNVYIADVGNYVIRKVDISGNISTFAGNGSYGYSGDGGPATSAQLGYPYGVAVDAAGNVYIADAGNYVIRKVDISGNISTFAGNGSYGYSGDGGQATSAQLSYPYGIAVDAAGALYISDYNNSVIRKVYPSGIIITFAGNGSPGYSGDGGPAAAAQLNNPLGVATDASANVYISDNNNNRIRKVYPNGMIQTIAGTGNLSYNGDNILATTANLYSPWYVAVDNSGDVYITDSGNSRVRKLGHVAAEAEINAPNFVCPYSTNNYSINEVYEATSYSWAVVGATLNSVSSGTLANISFSNTAGTISVVTTFSGGVTTTAIHTFDIVPPTLSLSPVSISSNTLFCSGGTQAFTLSATSSNTDMALHFKNTAQPGNIPINNLNDFTIEYWMRTDTIGASWGNQWWVGTGIIDADEGSIHDDFGTRLVGNKLAFGVGASNTGADYTIFSTSPVNTGKWVHVAASYSQSTGDMALYINGMQEASFTSPAIYTRYFSDIAIGFAHATSGPPFYSGDLDEIRIWSEVRNPAQIQSDMFASLNGSETDLLLAYDLNDSTGNTLHDLTSNYNINLDPVSYNWIGGYTTPNYVWNPGGYTSSMVSYTPTAPTIYTLTASDNYSCAANTYTQNVLIDVTPTISVNSGSICSGSVFTITPSGAYTYTLSSVSNTVMPVTNSYYTVAGSSSLGCLAVPEATAYVTINPSYSLSITGNQLICAGSTTSLTASGADTYSWSNGATSAGVSLTPSVTTIYTVVGTSTAGSCTDTKTFAVAVSTQETANIIKNFAGGGGSLGDGGAATSAELQYPFGISTDAFGNVYIADHNNHRIRKVDAVTGIINTIAGIGTPWYSGDGGPATSAELNYPFDVAVDATGNVYIADADNHRIRKIDAVTGIINTIAGTGAAGFSGDGSAASMAQLSSPQGIAIDAAGNIYVAEAGNHRIRKIDASTGNISTIAGIGSGSHSGDGGPATSAELNSPFDVTLDALGNIYIADLGNNCIRKITMPGGIISTIAGTTIAGFSGDNGQATLAQLNNPTSVALDPSGNVYIVDNNNHRLRKINAYTGIISTIAGSGSNGFGGDNGQAALADLSNPYGVAIDAIGKVYISDRNNHRIRSFYPLEIVATATTLCSSNNITLTANSSAQYYTWNTGETSFDIVKQPTVTTTYSVLSGCTSNSLNINVGITPTLSIAGSSLICSGSTASLIASGADTYLWSNASGSLAATANIVPNSSVSAAYSIIGTNTLAGCQSTANTFVKVSDPPIVNITPDSQLLCSGQSTSLTSVTRGRALDFDGINDNVTIPRTGNLNWSTDSVFTIETWFRFKDPSSQLWIKSSEYTPFYFGFGWYYGSAPYFGINNGGGWCGSLNNFGITVTPDFNWHHAAVVYDGPNSKLVSVYVDGLLSYSYNYACTTSVSSGGNIYLQYNDLDGSFQRGQVDELRIWNLARTQAEIQADMNACLTGNEAGLAAYFNMNQSDGSTTTLLDNTGGTHTGTLSGMSGNNWVTGIPSCDIASYTWNTGATTQSISITPSVTTSYTLTVNTSAGCTNTTTAQVVVNSIQTANIINTFAGNGTYGSVGDGSVATSAELSDTKGMAIDAAGNVYVADYGNHVVRKISPNGIITTIAGIPGLSGTSGDGGLATSAYLYSPAGVAVDAAGNVYISETSSSRVRKISPNGIITTFAGIAMTSGFSGDGGLATSAQLNYPVGLAVDAAGNLYIADQNNYRVRKVSPSGTITTVAGTGLPSYNGDNIAATSANFSVRDIAVDLAGNIYIADSGNNLIRKIDAGSGIITSVAGNTTTGIGYSGDGGAATAAYLNQPNGVDVDATGNVYIADFGNSVIRKITAATGIINTIAGDGTAGYSGDLGPAISAQLGQVRDLAVDARGRVFISDENNYRIRYLYNIDMVATPSVMCAGSNTVFIRASSPATTYTWNTGHSSDYIAVIPLSSETLTVTGGCATNTVALTVSPLPTLSVIGNSVACFGASLTYSISGADTYSWSTGGTGSTITLTPSVSTTYSVIGTTTAAACSDSETISITVSPTPTISIAGNQMICEGTSASLTANGADTYSWSSGDLTNSVNLAPIVNTTYTITGTNTLASCAQTKTFVVTINSVQTANIINTFAGGGSSGDGGAATTASLNVPFGAAVDASGNVYVAEYNGHRVRKISPNGIITTIAGTGSAGYNGDGIAAATAQINHPTGVAVDAVGNIYIADQYNNTIRKIDVNGIIHTIAGTTGINGFSGDGGPATAARLYLPLQVAVDAVGNIYIADQGNARIRKVDASGIINTYAGTVTGGYSGDGGLAVAAQIGAPTDVAVDAAGNVYIADQGNHAIRKVSTIGIITTIAGTGAAGFGGDGGAATTASLNMPTGVAADANGNVYIADQNNHRIRRINVSGIITSIAGTGTSGNNGDGNLATAAQLTGPSDVVVDALGRVFIADQSNSNIRVLYNLDIATTPSAVCFGNTATLTASSPATSYLWNTAQTFSSVAVQPTVASTYSVLAGCATASVSVMVNPLPVAQLASTNNSLCTGQSATLSVNTITNSYALDFDGVDDYVSIPYSSTLNTNNFTIEFWAKVNAVTPIHQSAVTSRGNFVGYSIYVNPSGEWEVDFGYGSTWLTVTGATVQPNQWTHVAASYDGSNMNLYINGEAVGTTNAPYVPNSNQPMYIGSGEYGGVPDYYFGGQIDEVRLWNTDLNSTQIQAEMGRCLSGNENNLRAYYAMSNGSGSSILSDNTSIGNTGSLQNMNTAAAWVSGMQTCNLNTYSWSSGGSTSSINVSPASTTSYVVTYTNAAGCQGLSSKNLVVNILPTIVTSGTTQICNGSFTNIIASGADTYSWSNGFTSSATAVFPTVNTTYTVVGTNTTTGCQNTAIKSLTVNPRPIISVNSGSICSGNVFTITLNGAATYTSASNFSVVVGSVTVAPVSSKNYTVSGTSSLGCVSSATEVGVVQVTVNITPTVSVNSGSICTGNNFTIIPSGANVYAISGGTDIVSPAPGITTYSVTGTSTAGCVSNNTVVSSVTVNIRPTIGVNSGSICSGYVFTMTPSGAFTYTYSSGTSTVNPLVDATYSVTGTNSLGCVSSSAAVANVTVHATPTLNVNSGAICLGNSFVITPSGANTYSVTGNNFTVSPGSQTNYSVTGTSSVGCAASNTAISTVTVNSLPVLAIAGSNTVCFSLAVSQTVSGTDSYSWSSGQNTDIVSLTPSVSTTYSVTGTNSLTGCKSTSTQAITVYTLPIISVNSGSICSNNVFTIVPSGANIYTYSSGTSTVAPLTSTNYAVTGTDALGCVSASAAVANVTVHTTPTVNLNGGAICIGETFTLVPTGANTFTLSSGISAVSPTTNTSYSVTGSSSVGCISYNTAVAEVTVNSLPVLTVAGTNTLCFNLSVTQTVSGADTYSWSSSQTTSVVSLSPSVNTTYSVTGTNTLTGCQNQITKAITVYTLPIISASSGSICSGKIFTINPSGALTYTYSSGVNTVNPISNISYSVTGTDALGCVSASVTVVNVTVVSLPVVSVNSGTVCNGSVFTMIPSGAATYTYSNGSSTVIPLSNNSYSVTGTSSVGCVSSNTAVSNVTVIALPVLSLSGNSTVCFADSLNQSVSGTDSYLWVNTGETVSTVTLIPSSSTTYSVIGTSSLTGCSSQITKLITVYSLPTISIIGNTVACTGSPLVLTGSGADTYTWSPGNFTGTTVSYSPATTATYIATGTSTDGCVSANTPSFVSPVYPSPQITITPTGTVNLFIGSGQTPAGSWNPWVFNFTDPLPVGSYITGIDMTYTGVDQGWGGTGMPTSMYFADEYIGGNVLTHSPAALSFSFKGRIPNYVYGGGNTFKLYFAGWPGWQGKISNTNLIIHYGTSSKTVCAGQLITLSAVESSGTITLNWSGGQTNNVPFFAPNSSQVYTVSGTNAYGCTTSLTESLIVKSIPTLAVNSGSICTGQSYTINASGANTYTWSTSSNNSSIVVNPMASTSYTVSGTNSLNCSSFVVSGVTVNITPTVSIAGSNTVCYTSYVLQTASGANTYTWSTGANTKTISVNPLSYTSYSVIGTTSLGCVSSNTAVSSVSVYSTPTIAVNSGTACPGTTFTMIPSGALTYTYSNGSPMVTINANNSYSVIGTNSLGCVALNSAVSSVTMTAAPALSVLGTSLVCEGASISQTVSGASNYTWSTGSTNAVITVIPPVSTTYTVSGINPVTGCFGSLSKHITVGSIPVISVNSGNVCSGGVFTLMPSGAATYTYSSGSNTVSPLVNTSYYVIGTSAEGCVSTSSVVANVIISPLPVIAVNNGTICSGNIFTIVPSGANTYTFSSVTNTVNPISNTSYSVFGTDILGCVSMMPGVSTVSVNTSPTIAALSASVCMGSSYTIVPNGAGTYTYSNGTSIVSPTSDTSYSITGSSMEGCAASNTAVVTVSVMALPVISVNSGSVCEGDVFTITPTGANTYTYSTYFNTPTIIPISNASYSVTGTSSVGCVASNPAIASVTLMPVPSISVSGGLICANDVFTITPSGASTYTYSSGSNTVAPNVTSSYTVTGSSAAGCAASNTVVAVVLVKPTPQLAVMGNSVLCYGNTSTLMVSGSADTYTWSSGTSSFVATGSVAVVTPSVTDTFTVTGVASNGCSNYATQIVSVNSLPIISVVGDTVCPGEPFVLQPNGAVTYTYSGGSATVTPSGTVTYSVTGTDANGCISLPSTATIVIANNVTVSVSGNTLVCSGSPASLTASGGTSYLWSTGQFTSDIAPTPTTNSTYTVIGAVGFCADTAVISVNVKDLPTPTVSSTPTVICPEQSATLVVSGAASYSYTWSENNQQTDSITVSPSVTTNYTVTALDITGCENTAVITMSVSDCLDIAENRNSDFTWNVYPNPNTGEFFVETDREVSVSILNVLGQVIKQEKLQSGKNPINLNTEAKGIYFVEIKYHNKVKTVKVVKQG